MFAPCTTGRAQTPCWARFSKKPLVTVSSGQLSSFRMGVGGSSSGAPPSTYGQVRSGQHKVRPVSSQ